MNLDLPKDSSLLLTNAIDKISSRLNNQLEDIIIEGLKRKGLEFQDRFAMLSFVELNCRCDDRPDLAQATYFVKDIPFLVHFYRAKISDPIITERKVSISADYGHYAFL